MWTNSSLSYHCSGSRGRQMTIVALATVKAALLLPLSGLVLRLALRQQGSLRSPSHSDLFTFHLSAIELIWVLGAVCYLGGVFGEVMPLISVGFFSFSFAFNGEMFLHSLTCVERYLAVVHPVAYLGLKGPRGARVRDLILGGVWVLSLGFGVLSTQTERNSEGALVIKFGLLVVSLVIISFCSAAVLRALIGPGPGGVGGAGGGGAGRSRQRAFQTITAVCGVLWLWFLGVLLASTLAKASLLSKDAACLLTANVGWFNLPCCLVSPLLYLQKARKLAAR